MNNTIKIVDFSTLIPGPFTSFILKNHLNAEVVKIEDINHPDALANMRPSEEGIGLGYIGINSGKKILRVDMRRNGIEKIMKEVRTASVFIENFKTGRASKLGLGYEDILAINPKVIYCSINGYSINHPLSRKSTHDLNILAICGYLDQQIRLGGSQALSPLLLADTFTAYHASVRILVSLLNRSEGSHLQISMYDAALEAMYFNNYPQITKKKEFSVNDFIMSGKFPCYSLYKSKDDGFVVVAALEKPLWIDFCHHLGHEEWIEEQFNINLLKNVSDEIKKYDRHHWFQDDLDFCVTPVLSICEAKKEKYV